MRRWGASACKCVLEWPKRAASVGSHARDGATIAWATGPYGEGSVVCRDHAQVCTISATAGSLLPVVPWDGEERVWGRTVPAASTEEGLRGASVPVAESIGTGRTPEESFAGGEEVAPDAPTGNGVISPNDTAGAPQEAEKKRDLPCNDDVAADGVTSVVGQPAGDEAASDSAGGGATTAGPKGSDAADAAQCAVDPPRSDEDAAVGRGDCEADM
ncbi:hypothetical protein MOQ_007631, partial [Trypanosoma cruzi marinkellei]